MFSSTAKRMSAKTITAKTTTAKTVFVRLQYLFAPLMLAGSLYATQPDSSGPSTFTGEVMDSLCAKAGSHDQMMQDMKSMGTDKKSCSTKCIQLGGKYVLFDSAKRAVYELDDQDKAGEFAGQRVRVSGSLQKKKIKITKIEAAN
jgi:hypothetical protein